MFLAFALCAVAGGAAAYLPAKQYQASTNLLLTPPSRPTPQPAVTVIQYELLVLPTEATSPSTLAGGPQRRPPADTRRRRQGHGRRPRRPPTSSPSAPRRRTRTWPPPSPTPSPTVVIALQGRNSPSTSPSRCRRPRRRRAPSNPTKPLLVGAVGFGIIAAVFAGLASAGVRRRFSRVTELKERIGATVLGEIPRVISGNIRPSSLFVLGRQPMVMEAFQELRSNLLLSIPDGGPDLDRGDVVRPVGGQDVGGRPTWPGHWRPRAVTSPPWTPTCASPCSTSSSRCPSDRAGQRWSGRRPAPRLEDDEPLPRRRPRRHPVPAPGRRGVGLPAPAAAQPAGAPADRHRRLPAHDRRGRDRSDRGHGGHGGRGRRHPAASTPSGSSSACCGSTGPVPTWSAWCSTAPGAGAGPAATSTATTAVRTAQLVPPGHAGTGRAGPERRGPGAVAGGPAATAGKAGPARRPSRWPSGAQPPGRRSSDRRRPVTAPDDAVPGAAGVAETETRRRRPAR